MRATMEKTKESNKKEKQGFFDLLAEDDTPEIGIATKEPLGEYFQGVKSEFKRVEWPSREQVVQEFLAVIIIVAIISAVIYGIDLGLDGFINIIAGK